jgi:hypothetical protein
MAKEAGEKEMSGLGTFAGCQLENMTCACMTNDAAAYWAMEWPRVVNVFIDWANVTLAVTFIAGLACGIILLLLADWAYKRVTKK